MRAGRRYGPCFTLDLAPLGKLVTVADPDGAHALLAGDASLVHAGAARLLLLPVLGSQSVLGLDGERHAEARRRLLPAFEADRRQERRDEMRAVAARHAERWPQRRPFRLDTRMRALSLEVFIRCILGTSGDEAVRELSSRVLGMLRLPVNFAPWHGNPPRGVMGGTAWRSFERPRRRVEEQLLAEVAAAHPSGDSVLGLLATARESRRMDEQEVRCSTSLLGC